MAWANHANTRRLELELGTDIERLVAEHDGYSRLTEPVEHRREIEYQRSTHLVRVTDQLRGSSAHRVEIFWHFATECQLTLAEESATATRDAVVLLLHWPAPLTARVVRGSEH